MTNRISLLPLPSYEELHRLFLYNPETGDLFWRERSGKNQFNQVFAGKVAGGLSSGHGRPNGRHRYVMVGFSVPRFHKIPSHRIIWKMVTGNEPPETIDHIDGDPLNLRWKNFRGATVSQNLCNAKRRDDNTSGVKGISWKRQAQKWVARVQLNNEPIHLGYFDSLEEAAAALEQERAKLHGEFANHG